MSRTPVRALTMVTVGLFLTQAAVAGPRSGRGGRNDSHETTDAEDIGLAFHDPAVGASAKLLDDGKLDEALEKLRAAMQRAPNSTELRLGMGMALIRAGRIFEAKAVLRKLDKSGGDPSVSERAHVMLRVAVANRPGQSLVTREAWRSALSAVVGEATSAIEKHHGAIQTAIDAGQWDAIESQLPTMRGDLAVGDAVSLADANQQVLGKHLNALRVEIEAINLYLSRATQHAGDLKNNLQTSNGRYRGGRKWKQERFANPVAKGEYNDLCRAIRQAVAAGQLLEDEYRAVRERSGLERGYPRKITVRKMRWPNPIP